tara:strand:+ start:34 stop:780 length:747 start_codon:yes stop_codon:yes gene_type:complete
MGLPKIAVPEYSLNLPSNGKELRYRPFLVKEEKILLMAMESENEKEIATATKNVIKNCVFGDYNIDEMSTFDIEYIFLWLRGKAKGEEINLKYKCPQCENELPVSFNIEDIEIERNEEHSNKISINENLGVVMKYPNMSLQLKIDSMKNLADIEKIFKTVLMCIDYIYDNEKMYSSKDHTEAEMQDFLESLSDKQFQKISSFFETMPKLKHEVKLECKHKVKAEGKKKDKVCGYTEDLVLEGLQSFFE